MKKIFIAILSVVFALFVFSACSDGVVKETTEDPIEYGEGIVPVDNYEDISYDIADGFFTYHGYRFRFSYSDLALSV